MSRLSRVVAAGIVIVLSTAFLAGAHHVPRNDPRIVEPYGVPVIFHQKIVAGYEPVPAPASCGLGAPVSAAAIYAEDFEDAHGWQFVGTPLATPAWGRTTPNLWRTSTYAGPGLDIGHSGPNRLWFGSPTAGNTFNVGHAAGSAQSPPVALPEVSPVVLTWAEKWQTESLKGYDHLWVEVTDSAGRIHLLCHSNSQVRADPDGVGGGSFQTSCSPNIVTPCTVAGGPNPAMAWMTRSIPLPASLLGDTVRVQFTFDSSDPAANWFMGWMIDDVQLVGVAAA